ncbi:MAG: protein arginine kinase [Planctomycetia bacterium]|nr:protein arginine kinase [Planctomycetia bacterium]
MDLDSLAQHCGEWLRGTGPDSDIVMSSRIRLARNLSEFPFPNRADDAAKLEIETLLSERMMALSQRQKLNYIRVSDLNALDRQFLVERQLISRELSESAGPRGVGISDAEDISVMINEEDHVRMQVIHSGFALDDCWAEINRVDDLLEQEISFAFDERLGYLTACPTNVGTGIRVSVMLHLPGLVLTKDIQKVFQALQKLRLAVRGLYGEGSQAMGDFYQISNQVTLGRSEEDLIKTIKEVIPSILKYERRARESLLRESREGLHDQIARAFGILSSAQTITTEETLHLLSSVRMGINLGLLDELQIPAINELLILTQPAHLQKVRKKPLESADRNIARASLLRQRLTAREHEKN